MPGNDFGILLEFCVYCIMITSIDHQINKVFLFKKKQDCCKTPYLSFLVDSA